MSTLAIDTIQGATTATSVDMSGITNLQMPAGHIIQIVNTATANQISTTSTSDVDTGVSLNITPKFSTSKLWLLFSSRLYISQHTAEYLVYIKNGSTIIGGGATLFNGSSGDRIAETCNIQGFHSPNSTSQLNYKITHRVSAGTGYMMPNSHPYDALLNFVILEIAQ
tara:strand:- start:202 stop:702 length:501 start_codon:yes stop_codon:yes gene_type:complete